MSESIDSMDVNNEKNCNMCIYNLIHMCHFHHPVCLLRLCTYMQKQLFCSSLNLFLLATYENINNNSQWQHSLQS